MVNLGPLNDKLVLCIHFTLSCNTQIVLLIEHNYQRLFVASIILYKVKKYAKPILNHAVNQALYMLVILVNPVKRKSGIIHVSNTSKSGETALYK